MKKIPIIDIKLIDFKSIWGKRKIKKPEKKYDAQKVIAAMTDDMVGITVFYGGGATIKEDDIKDFLDTEGHNFIKKNGQTYDEIIGLLEDGGFDVE